MPALLIGRNNGPASIPAASSHARSAFTAGLGATEIAKRLGRSWHSVKGRRLLLGIKFPNPRRRWPAAEPAKLGTLPDAVLAKEFARPESAVRNKRLQQEEAKKTTRGSFSTQG